MTNPDRASALAALVAAGARTGEQTTPAPPPPARTEAVVYAGGNVERLLIGEANLTYRDDERRLVYANARPGDVILVNEGQAERLDRIGVTVDPDTDPAEVAELTATGGPATDAELEAMRAAELVAYVAQNPTERDRVRELEEARSRPRATVLAAVEPTPDADLIAAEAALEAEPPIDEDDDNA